MATAEDTAAPEVTAESAPAAEMPPAQPEGVAKDWTRALVLAGGGTIARTEKRPVVVAEVRGDDGGLLAGQAYPKGADFYIRIDPEANLDPGQLTVGVDLEQGLLSGLSSAPGIVHVGPAHPAYAAVNVAALQGAQEIEVAGLSAAWKERLQPWFDGIATDARCPSDVKITLT